MVGWDARATSTKPPGGCPSDVQRVGPASGFQGLTGRDRAEAGGGGILSSKITIDRPMLGAALGKGCSGMEGSLPLWAVGEDKMTCVGT